MTNQRPVDDAMAANRPEKNFIRQLWVDEIRKVETQGYHDEYPIYLTLPGASGLEIGLLADKGIIRLTETGAIHDDDSHKVVAIESSKKAQVELLRRYPGLNVLRMSVQNLIRGDGQRQFPDNRDEITFCKAKVVNLDLNEPIKVDESVDELRIPVVEWIKKFCILHKEDGVNWSLCLTLHGEILWNAQVNEQASNLIVDNCHHDEVFKEKLQIHLGDSVVHTMFHGHIDFTNIDRDTMQKVAMVLIPKLLVRYAFQEGWKVSTIHNYAYEGGRGAPMVTWVFDFTLDPQATASSLSEYLSGIRTIFQRIGFIDATGEVHPFL